MASLDHSLWEAWMSVDERGWARMEQAQGEQMCLAR
jgi:hypothetical protein